MTATLIASIGELVTNNPELGPTRLGLMPDAAMVVSEGRVAWVGPGAQAPAADSVIDAAGRTVIPGFVDSHAHLVFAGERSAEFEARMAGESYAAGGIQTTVAATRSASDAELLANAKRLVAEMHASGITTFESKTGYGLTAEDELRALSIARELTDQTTLLAAHVVPPEFADDREGYVDLVAQTMIPASVGIARFADVFCDRGAFSVPQARKILEAAAKHGLLLKLHANQLENIGAVQLGVELGCVSVDHCTHLSPADIAALAESETVATLVPGAEFSTRSQYPDARALIDAGATVALATDCNPGSSFTTSMPFVIALAVREMQMTPAEALWSATRGGASALRLSDVGHLDVGARADFAIIDGPSHTHLSYRPGVQLVAATYLAGNQVFQRTGY